MRDGPYREAVLEQLIAGRSPAEIATTLHLSEHTVRHQLAALRQHHYVATTRQLIVKVLLERCEAAEQRAELAELRLAARSADDAMVERHRGLSR